MSWALALRVLLWLVERFGPRILAWTVQQLLEWVQARLEQSEPAEEPYIWDEEHTDLCR